MANRPVWAAEVRVPHICIMYVMDDGLSFGRSSSMDNKSYDLEKFIGEWYLLWAFSQCRPPKAPAVIEPHKRNPQNSSMKDLLLLLQCRLSLLFVCHLSDCIFGQ